MAEWISVKDGLPEYGQEVVAAVSIFYGGVFRKREKVGFVRNVGKQKEKKENDYG